MACDHPSTIIYIAAAALTNLIGIHTIGDVQSASYLKTDSFQLGILPLLVHNFAILFYVYTIIIVLLYLRHIIFMDFED